MRRAVILALALQALAVYADNPAFSGFTDLPLDFSAAVPSLQVLGTIPAHIEGSLFRNGPVNFASLNATHWFDGMGMLHAFAIKDGQVSYTAQYIRSAVYNHTINPCKRLFENSGADFVSSASRAPSSHSSSLSPKSSVGISHASVNTAVTIRRVAGHWISNTGFTSSNEFDPVTLNTIAAPFQYNDDLPSDYWGAPEHAQTDPAGEVVHYFYRFDDPQYQIYSIAPGSSTRVNIGRVPVNPLVGVPLYQHSFGLTEQYVILSEVPCTFGRTGWTSFEWIPNLPVTWRVVSRLTGNEVANFTSKPFFMMHHVHAYENPADHTVVIDLIIYPDNAILDALYLTTIQNKPEFLAQTMLAGKVARFALPMATPGVDVEPTILGPFLEMPIVNPIFQFHPYTYLYGIAYSDKEGSAGFLDAITQLNVQTGESKMWSEKGCYPSEPIFVPNPDAVHELDGVLLSVPLDVSKNQSFLLILDASDLSEIARAYVPNHIPYGFHGAYSNSLSGKVFHA